MRHVISLLTLLAPTFLLVACATTTPTPLPPDTTYVRAQATPDPPAPHPQIVQVPAPEPLPGQLKHFPPPVASHSSAPAPDPSAAKPAKPAKAASGASAKQPIPAAPAPKPQQAVQAANEEASQRPDKDAYFNAILQYVYEPGSLYQVYAAPMRVTDIALEPGEKIVGQPASGDVVRWVLALGKSMASGVEQWHVYIKPTRPELETNLAINTDRRSYMLELHSYPDTYMAAVQWHYPHDEIARLETQAADAAASAKDSAPVVGLDSLNFNYTIKVEKGWKDADGDTHPPMWTPLQVFDDGRRTFIRFPADMLVREAPALFVLRNKETQLVNYRVKHDFYVVDRLLDAAELRVGQKDQEIVRIQRSSTHHPEATDDRPTRDMSLAAENVRR